MDSVREVGAVKVLLELAGFHGVDLFGRLSAQVFTRVESHVFEVIGVIFIKILKLVGGGNESFELEVNEVDELLPSHPAGKDHDEGHAADLHFVDGLIEISLEDLDVVLFGVEVTFGRESGDFFLTEIVLNFPLLIFAELMEDFH